MTPPAPQPVAPAPDPAAASPALAGYAPLAVGRRVAVALVDALIVAALYGVAFAVVTVLGRESLVAGGVALGVIVLLLGLELWAVLGRSSRLAGLLLKARYVDVVAGRPAGGKLLLKQLLQALLAVVTVGIAPLVIVFASVRPPLNRNWFDRSTGLALIDLRRGRRPGDPLPVEAPAVVPRGGVQHVQYPAAAFAPAGQPPFRPEPYPPAPPAPPAVSATPAPAAPAPWVPTDEAGVITSIPRPGGSAAQPAAQAAPAASGPHTAENRPILVRDMRSVDAAVVDATMVAADPGLDPAGGAARVLLDDGRTLSLTPPTVVGRQPRIPGSHPDAVPLLVADPQASKTHLLVGRDDTGAWLIDLHSTNGVAVSKVPGTPPARVQAGRKVHLPPGATARFGEHTLTVR